MKSATYVVDGLRTHTLEAGDGPPLVLLHGGEWGGCATLTWERVIPGLAAEYRVIAPDWLGFGGSAKVVDLTDPGGRRIAHMHRLLETLDALDAAYIGNSMGGALLLAGISSRPKAFPARALVLAGAGGFVPNNAARQAAELYDGSFEGMRAFLKLLLYDQSLAQDDQYVGRWHRSSIAPGAFEVMASAKLTAPGETPRTPIGRPDVTPYEQLDIPTLVLGGEHDTMRLSGWMEEFVPRLPDARAIRYPNCGHMVPVDAPEKFTVDVAAFLRATYPA